MIPVYFAFCYVNLGFPSFHIFPFPEDAAYFIKYFAHVSTGWYVGQSSTTLQPITKEHLKPLGLQTWYTYSHQYADDNYRSVGQGQTLMKNYVETCHGPYNAY